MLKIGLLERTMISQLPSTYHAHDHIFGFQQISLPCDYREFHSILDLIYGDRLFRKDLDFAQSLMMFNLTGQNTEIKYEFEDAQGHIVDLVAYTAGKSWDGATAYAVECLSRSEQRGKMLVLVPSKDVQELTKDQLYLYLFHNIFVNQKLLAPGCTCASIPWELIETRVCANPRMNWVWFRKPQYKLHPQILRCARTWIGANPELTFQLWTNLRDEAELEDFLSDLDETDRQLFQDTIHVKYLQEMLDLVPEQLQDIFISEDPKDMILKTDAIRLRILEEHGGFYSDFNDAVCFVPLKLLFHHTEHECLFAADDDNHLIDNYFLYAPPHHPWIQRYASEVLADLPVLRTFLYTNRMADLYVDCAIDFVKSLLQQAAIRPRVTILNVLSIALRGFPMRLQAFLQGTTPPLPPKMLPKIQQEPAYRHAHLVLIVLELLGILPEVVKQGLKEIVNTRNMRFGRRVRWLNGTMTDQFETAQISQEYQAPTTVLTALSAVQQNAAFQDEFRFRFVRRFPGSFMEHTNIGTMIRRERERIPGLRVNTLPCCDFRYVVSMVTAISHIRDGTCTGGDKGHGEVLAGVL